MAAYASEDHSRAVLGGGWDCVTAALVVITCYHRAPSLWEVFQINQFESDLRSVGMAMVRGGIDLYVVMIAWEAASLIIRIDDRRISPRLLREISSLRVRQIAQNGHSGLCRKNYSERASFVMVTTDARRHAPQDSS